MVVRSWKCIIAPIIVLGISGCNQAHHIEGTWDISGVPGNASMTFQADGNYVTKASMMGRSSTVTGQYKFTGDSLTIQSRQPRTAKVEWKSEDEIVITGDDGKAMTLKRHKG